MTRKDKNGAAKFTKQQFLQSANFSPVERDVLRALMEDGQTYTHDQAKKLVGEFAKRKVE